MIILFADLHLHTTESDGTWEPRELVREAFSRGLSAIAITDHDTTAGVFEAMNTAPEKLTVIPGIELSSVAPDGEEVHILGLWIDVNYQPLTELMKKLQIDRVERIDKIITRLNDLGFHLDHSDVRKFAQKGILSRSHVAAALVDKGFVGTKQEAFDRFLGQEGLAYIDRFKISPEEAVRLILASGGVPVLAHPGLLRNLEIMPSIVEAGLVGIEVVHSTHSPDQTESFLALAKHWNLLPAGGSDCHGPGGKDEIYIGRFNIPIKWVEDLARKAKN